MYNTDIPSLTFPVILTICNSYVEDTCVCSSDGEPKGQCKNRGNKWYEHSLGILSGEDLQTAKKIQERRGIKGIKQ